MKKSFLSWLVFHAMLYASPTMADVLRLDKAVVLPSETSGRSKLLAFKSSTDCRIWNYIPGTITASGSFLQTTALSSVLVGTQKQLAFETSLNLMAAPTFTQEEVNRLRDIIYDSVRSDKTCDIASARDIVLTPALVQSQTNSDQETSDGIYFSQIYPTFGRAHPDAYRNPNDPISLTYVLDASDPATAGRLKTLRDRSSGKGMEIGTIIYSMQGELSVVDASITYSGKMSAKFSSALKTTQCSTSSSTKPTAESAALAIASGGVSAALGMGSPSSSITCNQSLLTQYESGALGIKFKENMGGNFIMDGKPIMYVTCDDNGTCHSMPLASFVRSQMFADLLLVNFDVTITKVQDGTFNITLGRVGEVNSDVNFDVGFNQAFNGHLGIQIPVFAERLDPMSFDLDWVTTPFGHCASENYRQQAAANVNVTPLLPLPVAAACLKPEVSQ